MAAGPTGIWFSGVDQSSSPPSPVVYYWSAGGLRKFPIPGRFEALAAVGQITYGVSEGQLLVNEGEDFTPSVSFRDITVKGIASTSTGLWVATASNEIWYAGVTVRKVGDANGQIIALAAGTAGELWYVLRTSEGQSLWCLELDHNTRKIADIPVRDASVVALSQDNTQTVWVAWSDKKLSRLSAGKWEVLDLSGTASALGTDDEGRLLIGYLKTPDQRAELLRLRDSQTLPIADAKGSVHAIVTDQLGGNWVAAGTSGAYRLEGLQGLNWLRGWEISSASGSQTIPITLQKQRSAAQSVNFAPIPGAKITTIGTNPNQGALANGTIGCITSDNNGAIYFGTGYAHVRGETIAGSGISRWDHRITTNWTSANGFALGTVNACANDPVTNRLWFGTQNGLVQFNPSNDTFSRAAIFVD